MPNDIFNTILNRKIATFKSIFLEDSESIFKIGGKLIHPQEFGIYRERVLSELIKAVTTKHIDIKDGFIITPNNKVSTQSDLIIFDVNNTPIINDGILRFFPIESIYAIGEVKSVINSKAELKSILLKLSNQKKLDSDLIKDDDSSVITFLVCKKFDYDFTKNFTDIYEDIEMRNWHNLILSIDDGLITYKLDRECINEANKALYDKVFGKDSGPLYWHPLWKGDRLKPIIKRQTTDDENLHIKIFLSSFSSALSYIKRPRVELQNYYL